MEKQAKQKIVIVGCGNVAWHIAKRLSALKKFQIEVYNHRENNLLRDFKTKLKCITGVGLEKIAGDASVYFICVTDKYISEVAEQLAVKNPSALVLHTSGNAPLEELGKRLHSTGVFYPLQSFSRSDEVNWKKVPLIIEADNRDSLRSISALAKQFSNSVVTLDYKSRQQLHLSAVLVNNFTNALYVSAFDLLAKQHNKEVNFKLLMPLIEQTTTKLATMDPRKAQTGPAKRKDERVMKKHLDLLSKQSDLNKIYKQLSKLIQKQQDK